jgi:hypothetical protein
MIWTEPGTLERLREALLTAGQWREIVGQIQKPPFEEITGVTIEYSRDKKTGEITTTDIKLSHADKLFVREDAGEWKLVDTDESIVSHAMVIEFKAVDSTGKNQEGKPYRIENTIDLLHAFVASPNPGCQVLKVKIVPPSCKLLYTTDGSDPANNGTPYHTPGIEAREGTSVRLYAEQSSISQEATIAVPKQKDKDAGTTAMDPTKPVRVNGRALTLGTRSETYKFLSTLSEGSCLQMVQIKVTLAATDNTVTLTWDRKSLLKPARVLAAFEFLDKEVPEGEWSLRFDQLHFATGKDLQQWQVDSNMKIEPGLITQ